MGNSTKRVDVLCGSHIPVLSTLIGQISEPILELGVGYGSTPLLHWMCEVRELPLYSLESDKEWLEKFKEFGDSNHKLFWIDFENNIADIMWSLSPSPEEYVGMRFGLVFVDHRPAKKRRSSALFFKDVARFVILHDSELADNPAYKYTPIYKEFKYKYEYTKTFPHTIILSNFYDPSLLFKD